MKEYIKWILLMTVLIINFHSSNESEGFSMVLKKIKDKKRYNHYSEFAMAETLARIPVFRPDLKGTNLKVVLVGEGSCRFLHYVGVLIKAPDAKSESNRNIMVFTNLDTTKAYVKFGYTEHFIATKIEDKEEANRRSKKFLDEMKNAKINIDKMIVSVYQSLLVEMGYVTVYSPPQNGTQRLHGFAFLLPNGTIDKHPMGLFLIDEKGQEMPVYPSSCGITKQISNPDIC